MILKLLLIGFVIYVVYFMFFKKKKQYSKTEETSTKKSEHVNELIQCPTCGVYVETEEAILSGATYYCSSECISKAS